MYIYIFKYILYMSVYGIVYIVYSTFPDNGLARKFSRCSITPKEGSEDIGKRNKKYFKDGGSGE